MRMQRPDRPDAVDLLARNREIVQLFYEQGATRQELAARYGLTPTGISGVLRQHVRGEAPSLRWRGTTAVVRRADSPIAGCPECGGMASRVAGSSYDDDGTFVRLRVCKDCGKPRPTAEVNIYGVTFSALDARGRLKRAGRAQKARTARAALR